MLLCCHQGSSLGTHAAVIAVGAIGAILVDNVSGASGNNAQGRGIINYIARFHIAAAHQPGAVGAVRAVAAVVAVGHVGAADVAVSVGTCCCRGAGVAHGDDCLLFSFFEYLAGSQRAWLLKLRLCVVGVVEVGEDGEREASM